jgi:restriction system protein
LVVDLLVAMGYGGSIKEAGRAIGKTGDEGIDGIIKEDVLGLDAIYIQAKKWEGVIGRPEIHRFVGALQGQRAKKGVFITTSKFSKDSIDYVSKIEQKIVLIDGNLLCGYMLDHSIGTIPDRFYELKKIDFDYFEEFN